MTSTVSPRDHDTDPAVAVPAGLQAQAVIRAARRRARRRRAAVAVAVIFTVSVGVAVWGHRGWEPLGASAGPEGGSAAVLARHPPAVRLVWDGPGSTFAVGDPVTGRTRAIPGPADSQCCLAVLGPNLFVGSATGVYRLDPAGGRPVRIAAGNVVFVAPGDGRLYTVTTDRRDAGLGGTLSLITTSGTRLGGPWTVPAGYDTPYAAVNNGIVLTRSGSFSVLSPWPVAVWNPAAGTLTRVGAADRASIVTHVGGGDGLIAATVESGRLAEGVWHHNGRTVKGSYQLEDLVLTDTTTGSHRTVPAPAGTLGFVGGGAFSPDGSELAAFVQLNHVLGPGLNGQVMELVIIDTVTARLHQIGGSWSDYGEPYGFATWSPDGRWTFFGGFTIPSSLDPPARDVLSDLGAYALGTTRATELRLPAEYSTVAAAAGS